MSEYTFVKVGNHILGIHNIVRMEDTGSQVTVYLTAGDPIKFSDPEREQISEWINSGICRNMNPSSGPQFGIIG